MSLFVSLASFNAIDYLFLFCGVSLWSNPFLVKVQYFVFSIIACKEGHEGTSVEIVDSVG